jgi:pimeloyl-ACP methyl ester carboxylesterase
MLKESSFDAGEVIINFAEGPDAGPPLILLHGLPSRWQEFLPLLPALCLQWHVYALDFRGQGKSGRVPGGYQAKHYVDDVISFLQNQINEPAVIFGLSTGGAVAFWAAGKCPERVRAVIAGDPPNDLNMLLPWMTSREFTNWFTAERQLAGLDLTIDELIKRISAIPVQISGQTAPILYGDRKDVDIIDICQLAIMLKHLDPGVLEYHAEGRATEFLEGFDLDRLLGSIKCPVLLLQADPALSGMVSDENVAHIQSVLPNLVHVLIQKDHGLGLDTWEVAPLMRAVTCFLDSV